SVQIDDAIWITDDATPFAIALVTVGYTNGSQELYTVPLVIATARAAEDLKQARPTAVLCDVEYDGTPGIVHDGLADDDACQALLHAIENQQEFRGQNGMITAFPTEAFAGIQVPAPPKVVRVSGEQSNSSILYGGRLILKLFRRLEEGPNPDFEIGRFL